MASTDFVYYPLPLLLTTTSPTEQSRSGDLAMICFIRPASEAGLAVPAAAIALILTAAPAFAGISCPMSINADQRLTAPVADWTTGTEKLPTELSGLTVYDGPPEELAALVPDGDSETAETATEFWTLAANSRGYWITCHYSSTTVTLTRRLPDSANRCEIVREKQIAFIGGQKVVRRMACSP